MSDLDAPTGLDLFGDTDQEREASRRHDSLRLTFDPVAGAVEYEIRVNGTSISSYTSGDWISIAQPNTRWNLEVRAIPAAGTASDWSEMFSTVSRPPVPTAPLRKKYDVGDLGIAIFWDVGVRFPGHDSSHSALWRNQAESTEELIFESTNLMGEHVDFRYERHIAKFYRTQIVVPRSSVPDDLLGVPNRSELSEPLVAKNPYNTTKPKNFVDPASLETRRNGMLARLLTGSMLDVK